MKRNVAIDESKNQLAGAEIEGASGDNFEKSGDLTEDAQPWQVHLVKVKTDLQGESFELDTRLLQEGR